MCEVIYSGMATMFTCKVVFHLFFSAATSFPLVVKFLGINHHLVRKLCAPLESVQLNHYLKLGGLTVILTSLYVSVNHHFTIAQIGSGIQKKKKNGIDIVEKQLI